MHGTISVIVRVNFWSGLLGSAGFVRKFLCTPCICGRPAEVQPRPDAQVVSAVESWWNMRWTSIATVPKWSLFCSWCNATHSHNCTDQIKTDEWDLAICIIRRRAVHTWSYSSSKRPSHTLPGNAEKLKRESKTPDPCSTPTQMEALAPIPNDQMCVSPNSRLLLLIIQRASVAISGWSTPYIYTRI